MMSSACIPARAGYVNLHEWLESDANSVENAHHRRPRVVDGGFSCQRLCLGNHSFSSKETALPHQRRRKKCSDRVKAGAAAAARGRRKRGFRPLMKKRLVVVKRVKELSCAVLCAIFLRLLSCSASVDVVERQVNQ